MSFTPDIPSTEDVLAAVLSSSVSPVPPQEQSYASTYVSWWETDPGEVYIHAEGGTADDRHYASTLVGLQLQAHGYRRAQFDLDASVAPDPPNYRKATSKDHCGTCKMFDKGICWGFGNKEVEADHVCDEFAQDDQHLGSRRITSGFFDRFRNPVKNYQNAIQGWDWGNWNPDKCQYCDQPTEYHWRHPGDWYDRYLCPEHNQELLAERDQGIGHPGVQEYTVSPYVSDGIGERPIEWKYGSRTSSWPDLMAKAKRLLQSGQVQVLRNGYNYIMGHVIGDHGEYDTELSRDDPQSRSITGWQCSCPWDQYAWQRTRKWKKFEGRPCSHVMALYWKALSTPLDEQLTPEQAEAMGTGQKLPPVAPVPEHPPEIEDRMMKGERPPPEGPRTFGPEGPIQGDQLQMNMPDAMGGPPGPAQAPLAPPPSGPQPPGILPPFPGEQMQMQWAGPGTTPGGQESPPGAYSVPGAKPPGTPPNPLQQPGTYSKVADGGMWTFPGPEGPIMTWRQQYAMGQISLEEYEALVDPYLQQLESQGKAIDWGMIHASADFNAPEPVRAKQPLMGLAEGPEKGQHGDGEYREVPAGTAGEVLSQDPSTGWIECLFPLENSGYHEPFHIRVFVEPGDIESAANLKPSDPFIRRRQ